MGLLLYIRKGRLIGHKPYLFEVAVGIEPSDVISDFLPQYYSHPAVAEVVPRHIHAIYLPCQKRLH